MMGELLAYGWVALACRSRDHFCCSTTGNPLVLIAVRQLFIQSL